MSVYDHIIAVSEANNNSFPASRITFENASTLLGKVPYQSGDRTGGEIFSANSCLWNDGKTALAYPDLWSGGLVEMGHITYYHENNGYYPAAIDVTEKGVSADRHPQPVFGYNDDGTMLVLQEKSHVGDINVFYGAADYSSFIEQTTITGALCGRLTMYKISTGWAVVYQEDQDDVVVRTCNADGSSWTSALKIGDFTSSSRGYPSKPFGLDQDDNGWYYLIIMPAYTSGDAIIKTKFLLKTQDFSTWSNYQETHSFSAGSPLTDAQFHANGYTYIGTYNVDREYNSLGGCITPEGEFYGFSSDYLTVNPFLKTTYWNGSSWSTNTANVGTNIIAPNTVDGTNPMWAHVVDGDIYLCISLASKPHMLRSINNGASWVDLGDMLPDRSGYYRVAGPMNAHEIPEDRNFSFFFSQNNFDNVTSVATDIYAVKAAFGTIQAETPVVYSNSPSSLTAITGADFVYGTDDYDSTVTGFYDKTGGGRTGTKVGSPVVTGGEMVFNGTNQSISVSTPGDLADLRFTMAFVARLNAGATGYIMSFANSGSTTAFCWVALTSSNTINVFWRSPSGTENTIMITSATVNTAVPHVFVIQGDGKHYRIYIDGVESAKVYNIGGGIGDLVWLGNWSSTITGMNSVRIGGIGRSGPVFTAAAIQGEIGYWPRVISKIERKQSENSLSARTGLGLTIYED